ncbi:MAG: hypothetical protein GY838_07400 [bacterium]|nr:hypothetical protein [bacterium]
MKTITCGVLAAALILTAGCTTKVETIHTGADFTPAALEEGILVLGGFVMASRLALDPAQEMPPGFAPDGHADQSDAWAPLLYGQFLAGAPQVQVWPWDQLAGRSDSATVALVQASVARGGVLRRDQLDQLAADLPEARFLAVARLDRNEVSLHESTEHAERTSWERDGLDGETQVRDRSLVTRRLVEVTLDVYDLAEGRSVWTATATRDAKELYNFAEAEETAVAGDMAENTAVRVKGTPRQGPPLEGLLEKACGQLVEQIVGGKAQK